MASGEPSAAVKLVKNQERSYFGKKLVNVPLNKYGWTALHAACYYGHINIVRYLVSVHYADVNATNHNGWHSLIFAVYGG